MFEDFGSMDPPEFSFWDPNYGHLLKTLGGPPSVASDAEELDHGEGGHHEAHAHHLVDVVQHLVSHAFATH